MEVEIGIQIVKVEINWYCNSNLSKIRSDLLSISWNSNLDGILTLNNGNSPIGWQGRLSAGVHTITLEINDGYHESVYSTISIEVMPSAPVLILDSPNLEKELRSNESILFDLRNSIDYDGDEFTWKLEDEAGNLKSNSGIELSNINPNEIHSISLPNGIHNLTLTLIDSRGMDSEYKMTLNVLSSSPIPSITSPIAHFEGNSNTFTFEAGENINFSAEESFDPDNDIVKFEWKIKTNSESWESIKSGKKTLVFGTSWFSDIHGCFKVNNQTTDDEIKRLNLRLKQLSAFAKVCSLIISTCVRNVFY